VTGIEAESELPYSGLSELMFPILDLLPEIPGPQADALTAALALGPPVPSEPFAVCAATLSLMAVAAEHQPVLAIADDVHWVDAASRDALIFAVRRLHRRSSGSPGRGPRRGAGRVSAAGHRGTPAAAPSFGRVSRADCSVGCRAGIG